MEAAGSIQKKGSPRKKRGGRSNRYGVDFKLQVVRKHLEESLPVSVIRQECGISSGTVRRWVRAYRREGEAGLAVNHGGKGHPLPSPVKEKIVELKRANPLFGITRISQFLKRTFFLSAIQATESTFKGCIANKAATKMLL